MQRLAIRIQKLTLPAELALGPSQALVIPSYDLLQGALHVAPRPSLSLILWSPTRRLVEVGCFDNDYE